MIAVIVWAAVIVAISTTDVSSDSSGDGSQVGACWETLDHSEGQHWKDTFEGQ